VAFTQAYGDYMTGRPRTTSPHAGNRVNRQGILMDVFFCDECNDAVVRYRMHTEPQKPVKRCPDCAVKEWERIVHQREQLQ